TSSLPKVSGGRSTNAGRGPGDDVGAIHGQYSSQQVRNRDPLTRAPACPAPPCLVANQLARGGATRWCNIVTAALRCTSYAGTDQRVSGNRSQRRLDILE